MTEVIIYKMAAFAVAGVALFWTAEELYNHWKGFDGRHHWQWRETYTENRTADVMWLNDFFWILVRLIGSLGMLGVVIYFSVTR